MANNRMYIQCKECAEAFFLAKYYPNTGYYTSASYYSEDFIKLFNDWLDKHRHNNDQTIFGKWQYELSYEIIGNDSNPKEAILNAISEKFKKNKKHDI